MEINKKIENLIKENKVCLFMKGTPDSPQCGFSMAVSNVLKHMNINFKGINVLEDENLRQGIKDFSDWPTIPQLYLDGEFIGGCDIIKEMFETGELKKLLEKKRNNLIYFFLIKHISESDKFPLYISIFFILLNKYIWSCSLIIDDLKLRLSIIFVNSSSIKISSTFLL